MFGLLVGGDVGGLLVGGGDVVVGGGVVGCCLATWRVIEVPFGTTVPGVGYMPTTVPGVVPPVAGTELTVLVRPKPCRRAWATWSDWPISFGTLTPPPETTSVTEVPGFTDVPASGFCLITVPCGWVEFGLVRTCGLRPLLLTVFCA